MKDNTPEEMQILDDLIASFCDHCSVPVPFSESEKEEVYKRMLDVGALDANEVKALRRSRTKA